MISGQSVLLLLLQTQKGKNELTVSRGAGPVKWCIVPDSALSGPWTRTARNRMWALCVTDSVIFTSRSADLACRRANCVPCKLQDLRIVIWYCNLSLLQIHSCGTHRRYFKSPSSSLILLPAWIGIHGQSNVCSLCHLPYLEGTALGTSDFRDRTERTPVGHTVWANGLLLLL